MIITQNEQAPLDNTAPECAASSLLSELHTSNSSNMTAFPLPAPLHLQNQIITHHPRAGVNPVVDAASHLFTLLGQLTSSNHPHQPDQLQHELIHEINTFQETIKLHGYNAEYILVCRYIICATFDELIENAGWGGLLLWENYSLLNAYNQDTNHHEKFFSIMERAIKEPEYYIDLMELMYICLSMGYRGRHHGSEQNQIELELISNSLYKHIRAQRGNFSKTLSPEPIKTPRVIKRNFSHAAGSYWVFALLTACAIMVLFISLGYLMEMISNEAINHLRDIQKTANLNNSQQ